MSIYGSASGVNVIFNKNNPSVAFGGPTTPPAPDPFSDDSDLKGYWKFNNETAGTDIENVSESAASVGASGDIEISNATYNQASFADWATSMYFDVDNSAYGQFGGSSGSLTDWKFFHYKSGGVTSSINFWAKVISSPPASGDPYFLSQVQTAASGVSGFLVRYPSYTIDYVVQSGTTTICDKKSATDYIPDQDSWHMYTIQFAEGLGSDNYSLWRDAGNEFNADTTGSGNNTSSAYPLAIAARGTDLADFGDFYISELSFWDRILTDAEIVELYNSGEGRPLY